MILLITRLKIQRMKKIIRGLNSSHSYDMDAVEF